MAKKTPHQAMKGLVDRIMEATKTERQTMDRYMKRFNGEWWNEKQLDSQDSRIFVNYIFSTVMTIAPHLTANRLQWSAKARLPFFQNYINGWKMSADYLWDKEELDGKLMDAVLAALIMKLGLWKVYWQPSEETGGEVAVDVVDPRTFFFAPGYDDLWKVPMCGTVERKPISWIREYFPKAGTAVKPDQNTDRNIKDAEPFEFHDLFANFYTVWFRDGELENYFIETETGEPEKKGERKKYPYGRLVYFTDDVWLADQPCDYRHGKPPYVALYDYRIPFQIVGGGEADQTENLNLSFNRNLQLLDRNAAFYCDPPQFVDSNLGVDFERYKTEYKKGGGVFEFNGMNLVSTQRGPIWSPDPKPVGRAAMDQMAMIPRLIEELSGTPDITKGVVSKQQRQSATEIGTIAEFGMARTRGRVGNLENFLKRAYYLILSLQMQYYTEPRYFNYRDTEAGNELRWDYISNSKASADRMVGPSRDIDRTQASESEQRQAELDQKDYQDFLEFTEKLGDLDPVYAAFDLEVQTTTTLPLDQQSLANLYLRLLQMGSANPVTGMPMWKAALRNLKVPGYREIIDEMERLFQQSSKPPGGGPSGPSPASPLASILNQGGVTT